MTFDELFAIGDTLFDFLLLRGLDAMLQRHATCPRVAFCVTPPLQEGHPAMPLRRHKGLRFLSRT